MSAEIMCVALDMSVQYVQMRCVFAFVILQCVRHNGVYYLRHSADTLPRERESGDDPILSRFNQVEIRAPRLSLSLFASHLFIISFTVCLRRYNEC